MVNMYIVKLITYLVTGIIIVAVMCALSGCGPVEVIVGLFMAVIFGILKG